MKNANVISIQVAKVNFREDLYPRQKLDPVTVQKYAEDLEVLPPIEVNQHHDLIDGRHRLTAHLKQEAKEIKAFVTETASDAEFLELAIERNSKHGLQLSQSDKRDMARKIYGLTAERERDTKKTELAKILSVSERTIRDWLSRIDKDAKEAREKRIFELWLACWTQEEIAERVGCDRVEVTRFVQNGKPAEMNKTPNADHATDFDPPLYNVWKQQEKTAGSNHYGNSEPRWVDNLLYLYTKPFDIVVDPFAGGGSTIDVCRKRMRRFWVGDRKPVIERKEEIRQHDLVADGLPDLKGRWGDVGLVYLDPPYWKQAEGKYSKDATDLANQELDEFNKNLAAIINGFLAKLKDGHGVVALIIQPTQWKAPERRYTDHVADMIRAVKSPVVMRIQAPYESQQCTAQMVNWAKDNRQVLVLSREIVVWRNGT